MRASVNPHERGFPTRSWAYRAYPAIERVADALLQKSTCTLSHFVPYPSTGGAHVHLHLAKLPSPVSLLSLHLPQFISPQQYPCPSPQASHELHAGEAARPTCPSSTPAPAKPFHSSFDLC